MCMHYISYWGGHNHFSFVGDSRVRQLYHKFVSLISDGSTEEEQANDKGKVHHDLHFSDSKINIKIVSSQIIETYNHYISFLVSYFYSQDMVKSIDV